HVVADQTPVALVEYAGIVIGGTSIEGGYGIDPVTSEAVLFGWDPTRGETLWQQAPVPGAATIAGLCIDEDEILWGIADSNTVFSFDLDSRKTLRIVPIDPDQEPQRYGNTDRLRMDNGRLFGSAANQIFLVDRVTGYLTTLHEGPMEQQADGISELAQDLSGNFYFVNAGSRLMKYTMPSDRTAPVVEAALTPPDPRPANRLTAASAPPTTRHGTLGFTIASAKVTGRYTHAPCWCSQMRPCTTGPSMRPVTRARSVASILPRELVRQDLDEDEDGSELASLKTRCDGSWCCRRRLPCTRPLRHGSQLR